MKKNNFKSTFGSFIREQRIKLEVGQRELAGKLGIAASYLNDIEKNKRKAPKQIIIKKPSGTKVTANTAFSTDGTDGKMYYNAVDGDLDESGSYKLQGKVVISDGTFYTDITSFKVHRNL